MNKFKVVFLLIASVCSLEVCAKIQLGIDVLESQNFKILAHKRVGLLSHPAGVNARGVRTAEILWNAPRVNLVALFGPEHGYDGGSRAEIFVNNSKDQQKNIPIYSLYGPTRRPTKEMLKNLDVMVVDLQDIGARSYTYLCCLKYVMEECFKAGITVIVLDRPNPLGGLKVDGPILEQEWISYVGPYPIPYVYGLTIGELALMAKKEKGWLELSPKVRKHGKLVVIPMKGWKRSFLWPDTGLKWVPTSPAITSFEAALGYSMLGLGCQLGSFKHGYGGPFPFRFITHPEHSPQQIRLELVKKNISGVSFTPLTVQTKNIKKVTEGLFVEITDYASWQPTQASFYLMQLACKQWGQAKGENPFKKASVLQAKLFNKHVGSTEWWEAITHFGANVPVEKFIKKWTIQAKRFQAHSRHYWLY